MSAGHHHEHALTTAELEDLLDHALADPRIKARLARLENKRKLNDGGKGNQPTLRRASTSNNDPNAPPDSTQPGNDRPTLQRRNDN